MSDTPAVYFLDNIEEISSFVHSSALDREGPQLRTIVEQDLRRTAAEIAPQMGWAAHGLITRWEPAEGGEALVGELVEVPAYTEVVRDFLHFPSPPPLEIPLLINTTEITTKITLQVRPLVVDGMKMYGSLFNRRLYLITDPEPLPA